MEFTVEAKTCPGLTGQDADLALDRLLRDPRALGVGGIGMEEDSSLFTVFQVETDSAADAAHVGCELFERALDTSRGRVVDLHVYEGGPREV